MAASSSNPLISSQKTSQLEAVLHPLVLLTISDYITRHTLRQQKGPIVGALLGQQNGREITIEHAFECHMELADAEGVYKLHGDHFDKRLEQMKTVHKDRLLDLVGWYTLLSPYGPTPAMLILHNQILEKNEAAILLGFHPEEVLDHSVGGKLPLTIYESNYEVEDVKQDGEDKKMDDGEPTLQLKFRELPYSVETDETEMISMNYVAAGSGNAAAAAKEERPGWSIEHDRKGKRRLVESEEDEARPPPQDDTTFLNREEDEMIASLTAKANAIKMLQSRIELLTKYLEQLPEGYISGQTEDLGNMDTGNTSPSLVVLRQIQALVSRLDLVIPSDGEKFDKEMLSEANDVNVVSLLNSIMQGANEAKSVGSKFANIEVMKGSKRRAADFSSTSREGTFGISAAGDLM